MHVVIRKECPQYIEALMLPKTSEYIATIFFENWAVRD